MKRVFGLVEAIFDISYLSLVLLSACILFGVRSAGGVSILAGCMALILLFGDSCHLIPRIKVIANQSDKSFSRELGRGKQITSITMTLFYVLLWHLGLGLFSFDVSKFWSVLLYVLALLRIILCLLPQNRWTNFDISIRWNVNSLIRWNILRNIPFFVIGTIVGLLFFVHQSEVAAIQRMWFAILLSFLFYFPVVIWSNKNPRLGMLMLPKSCMYLWMLGMCLSLKS